MSGCRSSNNLTASRVVTIDNTSRTVGTLIIGDPVSSFFNYTLAASGGAGLSFTNNGSTAYLIQTNNTSASDTISAPPAAALSRPGSAPLARAEPVRIVPLVLRALWALVVGFFRRLLGLGLLDQGGDLGWFAQGVMTPAFDSAAFNTPEGTLVKPFRTPFGWHILKQLGYRTDDEAVEGTPFEKLPASWTCRICGAHKDTFEKVR